MRPQITAQSTNSLIDRLAAIYPWFAVAILSLTYTMSIADRYVISTIMEPIRIDLGLSDSGIAFLGGAVLALFYVGAGLPIAKIADRHNRRNILGISVFLWSAMTAICGVTHGFLQLLLARIGVGTGEAGATPASTSIIADLFRAPARPMAMTVFTLGVPAGAWLGSEAAGRIADAHGWRMTFLLLGLPGLAIGVLVMTLIKEPPRGRYDHGMSSRGKASLLSTLKFISRQRSAFHVIMGTSVVAFWGWGILWWTPTYFMRMYGMSMGQIGADLGRVHLIAGIVSTAATVWLLGHPAFRDPRRLVWCLAGCVALSTVPSAVLFLAPSESMAVAMLWLFVPVLYLHIGPSMGLLQNLVPPEMRAQTIAILLLLCNVANLILSPQLVGFVSDILMHTGHSSAASLQIAVLVLAPSGLWAAYHYWKAARSVRADIESVNSSS